MQEEEEEGNGKKEDALEVTDLNTIAIIATF